MNESFSFGDAIDTLTGVRAFLMSVLKSNKDLDSRFTHDLVRDNISPNLPLFTPRIVEQLERVVEEQLGYCEGKAVEKPIKIVQDMIAYASKCLSLIIFIHCGMCMHAYMCVVVIVLLLLRDLCYSTFLSLCLNVTSGQCVYGSRGRQGTYCHRHLHPGTVPQLRFIIFS